MYINFQLHGEGARSSFAKLPSHLRKIYVLNVNTDGIIQTIFPEAQDEVDWFLLDSLQGGRYILWILIEPKVIYGIKHQNIPN